MEEGPGFSSNEALCVCMLLFCGDVFPPLFRTTSLALTFILSWTFHGL